MDMDPVLWWGVAKATALLLFLAPLIYFLTKWYAKSQGFSASLSVKERVNLGTNKFLYIVQWQDFEYLLAVTPQRVECVDKRTVTAQTPPDLPRKEENHHSQSTD